MIRGASEGTIDIRLSFGLTTHPSVWTSSFPTNPSTGDFICWVLFEKRIAFIWALSSLFSFSLLRLDFMVFIAFWFSSMISSSFLFDSFSLYRAISLCSFKFMIILLTSSYSFLAIRSSTFCSLVLASSSLFRRRLSLFTSLSLALISSLAEFSLALLLS